MKKAILIFLYTLTVISAAAQGFSVRGRIIDGGTNKPLDFVNVALYKLGTETPVTGGFSDIEGKFELTAPAGDYTFKASFVGYTEFSKEISLSQQKPRIRLGNITIKEDAKQIAEIEVVGQKSGMTLDIDKKIFNVDQSAISAGSTAAEILENIPSVNIDIEGNVSLRNSSSVEIWINGKPSGLSDTDKGQILEMLPADAVKAVEVITNPSAKYNPEGNAGIINIVMRDDAKGGFFGNANVGLNYKEGSPYPGGQAGLNFNYSKSKLDFNISANVRSNRNDQSSILNRANYTANDTTYLNQRNKGFGDRISGFMRAGFNYRITDIDEIGLQAFGMVGKNWNNREIDYIELDRHKDTTLTRDRYVHSEGLMAFYNVTASYKHSFIKDAHFISADLTYSGNQRNSKSQYATNEYLPDHTPVPDKKVRELQTLNSPANRASAQVDYSNKITEDHKIEAGIKASMDIQDSYDHTFDSIPGTTDIKEDMSKYNPFHYSEQIYAAYISYAGKFNWFSLQAGLRCEETITNTSSLVDGKTENYHRSYFQPFPSLYLGFEIDKTNTLQLNYTRRINRPRGRMLNSYVDRGDPANISQGNPWLMPEFGNSVEFNYLKTWDMHTLSVGLFYNYTENVIQRVSKLQSDGTMYNTFDNITYSHNAGAEIVAKNRLFHNYLDLTTSLSGYYYQLGENKEYNIKRTDTFSWNARINANVKIIDNLAAQVSAFYDSPRIVAQGSEDHTYGLDLGLKATFLAKALTINFAVRDVLNSRRTNNKITQSDNFYQENRNTDCGRRYRLTITYNFGNMKSNNKMKNRDNNSENDFLDEEF